MKKYEDQGRRTTLRSRASAWTALLALLVVVVLILRFRESVPPDFLYKGTAAVAVIILVLRQVSRRLKTNGPRSARPDPKSALNLSD